MAGTFSSAVKNAASDMAASALMPARSSSLFFMLRVSFAARSLRASITRYSVFGMVKLSRTNLGFMGFSALLTFTVLTGLVILTVLIGAGVFACEALAATSLLAALPDAENLIFLATVTDFFIGDFISPVKVVALDGAGKLEAFETAGANDDAAGATGKALVLEIVISFPGCKHLIKLCIQFISFKT